MYFTGLHSDHSAFLVVIDFIKHERGRGYWKLNTSHLKLPEYLELINERISTDLRQYAELKGKKKWEMIKFNIATVSQQFARERASQTRLIIAQLSEKVTELEEKVSTQPDIQSIEMLEKTKDDLSEIQTDHIKGVIFRSGAKTIGEFERNTAYFYALEKSKYNAKTCYALWNDKQELITRPQEILDLQYDYYKKLYQKDDDVVFTLENHTNIKVPEEINEMQNTPFNLEEMSVACKQLSNNKVAGLDGIPVDLYKVFWNKLKYAFMEMIEDSSNEGLLTDSMLMGIINLIPKANKNS